MPYDMSVIQYSILKMTYNNLDMEHYRDLVFSRQAEMADDILKQLVVWGEHPVQENLDIFEYMRSLIKCCRNWML